MDKKLAEISWESKSGKGYHERVKFDTLPVEVKGEKCFVNIDGKQIPIGIISEKQPSGIFLMPGSLAHYLREKTGEQKYVRIMIKDVKPPRKVNERSLTVKLADMVRFKENNK